MSSSDEHAGSLEDAEVIAEEEEMSPKKMGESSPNRTSPIPPEDPCPVCLSERKHVSSIDGCSHTFCNSCINEWLKVSETCPMCKAPVTQVSTDMDGILVVKTTLELKNEAESRRLLEQEGESPMVTEREAVTHHIRLQRGIVQRLVEARSGRSSKTNRYQNEMYRHETSKLSELLALRDEMDRLPRRDIIGDARFRQVVYEGNLQFRAITRPTTTVRFTPAMACLEEERIKDKILAFIKREVKFLMIDKRNFARTGPKAAEKVWTMILNYNINHPEFEMVMLNSRLFIPTYLPIFSNLLYEFCASGLDLPSFDANSSFSLDPARAPSGRLVPNMIPANGTNGTGGTNEGNEPIFIGAEEESEDGTSDIIIERDSGGESSGDSVSPLYNHRACRMREPLPPVPVLPLNLGNLMSGLFASSSFGGLTIPHLRTGGMPSTSRGGAMTEVISLDDDRPHEDVARVNAIFPPGPRLPEWLNVTGAPIPGRSAEDEIRKRLQSRRESRLLNKQRKRRAEETVDVEREEERERERRREQEYPLGGRWREAGSWSELKERRERERRREAREEWGRREEKWMGERIDSRRNTLKYYHERMRGEQREERLEELKVELDALILRAAGMRKEIDKKIEERKNGREGEQDESIQVIGVDEPSTSNSIDDSIVIL